MARNPIITDEIEAIIGGFYYRHPTWKAWEIQKRVSQLLHKKKPDLPPNWPGLSAVQKVLAKVKKGNMPYPQDRPWSMAALDTYPELKIESPSPEALSIVLKVWKSHMEQGQDFSIREAKWAARLSHLLKDVTKLSVQASQYARLELIYQIIDRPFDSTGIDKLLMGIPLKITGKDEWGFLPILAGQEDSVNQIWDLKRGKVKEVTIDLEDKSKGGTK